MSINKAIILGRVGKDPEIRYMTNGEAVASFSIATSEKWKDKSGETQEKTEWHSVTAFRKLAEVIGEYTHKGDLLYMEGKITTEKYTDKQGVEKYTTKIIADKIDFIGGKREQSDEPRNEPKSAPAKTAKPASGFDEFDEQIPF
ncbi:Ssb Single-stranded DNA-binding protein [uncultured Caudovirales phage]|uniref:Single-stranded DNA-binding protein n=1 Tax=uncultured Caudovirales phage TaxID=2100421 RepID=A0A6J5LFL6_9CAUD|nr:Ssb Single-stranded DNA-binding protein [uncultured Caudovirales phage]